MPFITSFCHTSGLQKNQRNVLILFRIHKVHWFVCSFLSQFTQVKMGCVVFFVSVYTCHTNGCRKKISETFWYHLVCTIYISSCVLLSVSLHKLQWLVWSFPCQFTQVTMISASLFYVTQVTIVTQS